MMPILPDVLTLAPSLDLSVLNVFLPNIVQTVLIFPDNKLRLNKGEMVIRPLLRGQIYTLPSRQSRDTLSCIQEDAENKNTSCQ